MRVLGTTCRITYRAHGNQAPDTGHYLETMRGSCYLIMEKRAIRSDERHLRLTCLRVSGQEISECDTVHSLIWDSRKKR